MSYEGQGVVAGHVLTWDGTKEVWGPVGGGILPLSSVLYADVGTTSVAQDGSIADPFSSIQAALNATTLGNVWTIIVANGTYAESPVVPSGRTAVFIVAETEATVTGSVTWANTVASGILGLSRVSVGTNVTLSAAGGVAGSFFWDGPGTIGGALNAAGYLGALDLRFSSNIAEGTGKITGAVTGTTATLSAYEYDFGGAVSVGSYQQLVGCLFESNFTTAAVPTDPRARFERCVFTAAPPTFTGPANSFRLDGTTEFSFEQQAGVLAGGATYRRIDDPIQVSATTAVDVTMAAPNRVYWVTIVPRTVRLPNTATVSPKLDDEFKVKDVTGTASAATPIIVDGNGKLIDGAATRQITDPFGFVSVKYDGTQWRVFSSSDPNSGLLPLAREIYVDPNTAVATVDQDGSIVTPFATPAQAETVAAALPAGQPVVIRLTAGIYTDLPLRPPARDLLSYQGSGINETIINIVNPAITAGLLWSPSAVAGALLKSARFADMTIQVALAGQFCIDMVSSTVAPDTMFGTTGQNVVLIGGLVFDNVNCVGPAATTTVRLTGLGRVNVFRCGWAGDPVARDGLTLIFNCSLPTFDSGVVGNFDLSWDQGVAPVNGLGRSSGLVFRDGDIVKVTTLRAQVRAAFLGVTRALGAVTGVGLSVNGTLGPILGLNTGALAVVGAVTWNLPDLTGASGVVNLDQARFLSTNTYSVAAGAVRVALTARGAFFGTVSANGISFGNGIDADIRQAFYNASIVQVVAGATLDRSFQRTQAPVAAAAAGPNVLAIPGPPYPAVAVANVLTVVVQQVAGVHAPSLVTARTATTVTVDYAGADANRTVDFLINRP